MSIHLVTKFEKKYILTDPTNVDVRATQGAPSLQHRRTVYTKYVKAPASQPFRFCGCYLLPAGSCLVGARLNAHTPRSCAARRLLPFSQLKRGTARCLPGLAAHTPSSCLCT
jgi:hypothetical protein